MKKYIVDGNEFATRESAYNHLTKVFGFSDSFGNNLDALWDELTDLEDVVIEIKNAREIPRALEEYGLKILDVFGDLYDEGIEVKIYW
ncbi:barstar family protein [Peptoniphilus indolicus]|uniref:Ribonuclease barnase inhibitor n=2 Tax=Peptoniphilus indolicus TaxID=33030 RepID=G4D220_9FIRM|nr:barstar family protein [Peptoniphilus indolicus]EGY80451.1 ribonuclease barnase inhibitor [Peptoniphilus indolicus ATCC 29427]SUB75469.1 Ribonuclease inhibitor [Peptoniphilus indolicus]